MDLNRTIPGLEAEELALLRKIFADLGEVFVFGSRARGTHRPFSDVDILLKPDRKLFSEELDTLRAACQNSSLPFKVDVVEASSISEDFWTLIQASMIRILP